MSIGYILCVPTYSLLHSVSIFYVCLQILNALTHKNTFLHCSLFMYTCKQMHISRAGIIFF